jgi:hypothetical protein
VLLQKSLALFNSSIWKCRKLCFEKVENVKNEFFLKGKLVFFKVARVERAGDDFFVNIKKDPGSHSWGKKAQKEAGEVEYFLKTKNKSQIPLKTQ